MNANADIAGLVEKWRNADLTKYVEDGSDNFEYDGGKIAAMRTELLDALTAAEAKLAKAREALKPFAAKDVKGGTPEARKLQALICELLDRTSTGDGLDVLIEFVNACLIARSTLAALEE